MQTKVQQTLTRLKNDIQARDYEGVTTVMTADIHILLGHIKNLEKIQAHLKEFQDVEPYTQDNCHGCDALHVFKSDRYFCTKYLEWVIDLNAGPDSHVTRFQRCPKCLEEN